MWILVYSCAIKKWCPFIQSLVGVEVESPLVYDQPEGKVIFDDKVMIFGCSNRGWPDGVIDI
jgi:hypothetical protein